MVEVIKQRPMSILYPYMVEVNVVVVGGSEACLALNQLKAFCARDGAVKEAKLELVFSRYETYKDKTRLERCTAPRSCWPLPPRRGNT